MQEEEMIVMIIAMLSFFIGMPWIVFRGIYRLRAQKMEMTRLQGHPAGGELTGGELKTLIQEAVEDAQAPLADRMDRIERQVRRQSRMLTTPAEREPALALPEPSGSDPSTSA